MFHCEREISLVFRIAAIYIYIYLCKLVECILHDVIHMGIQLDAVCLAKRTPSSSSSQSS